MATEAEIKTIVSANIADFEAKMRRATEQLSRTEKKFKDSGDRIGGSFESMKRGVQGFLAAFAVREVVQFGSELVEMAGHLKDLSLQTGISSGTLSALGETLKANGSSVDDFATSVTRMNRNIADAASGDNEKVAAGLEKIGLKIDEIVKLSPEQQFFKIAEGLGKIKNQGELTAIGVELFGKSFSALIPVIRDTNGELKKYVDEAQKSGSALTPEQVDTLDAFGDAIEGMGIKAKNAVAGGLADFLKWTGDFRRAWGKGIQIITPEDLKNIDAYKAKAQALGFKTEATFAVDKGEVFGPPAPSAKKKTAGKTGDTVDKQYGRIKDSIDKAKKSQDEFNDKMLEAQKFSNELGGAFRDAFADGVLGANKFGDVLGALGRRITQIFFNKLVGDPISKFFNDAAGSIFGGSGGGGIGSFLGKILPTFSFATGTSNVPYDTVAMLHKGEQVLTKSQVDAMGKNSGGAVARGNTYVIDARGADAGAVARIERSLVALAGPGVIERRVVNAQKRGEV